MYELTFLINPNISKEELEDVFAQLKDRIIRSNGQITKDFSSQKIALAYPVKKLRQAYLVSLDFDVERDKIETIKAHLKDTRAVLRHLLITKHLVKIKPKKIKPLKPRPLTIAPQPKTKVKIEELDKKLEEILEE
jgi:ribosomal protein S6